MISDESKKHEIVKFQSRKSTPRYPECKSHNKQQSTMFCKKCDIPVCTKCLASDQHLGHKLLEIMQALDEKKDKITKQQTELKETIYPTYQDIASDKLKAEVDEIKNTQLQTLQKHLDEINKAMSDIKDEINLVEMDIDTYDLSKLFDFTSNVNIYRILPQKFAPSLPKFTPGKIQGEKLGKLFGTLSSSSLTLDKHGYSMKTTEKSLEAGSSPRVKQLLDKPEIVTTIDTEYNQIYSMACVSDKEIWTKGYDSTMKLYSINQGSLLKSITTRSGNIPQDIAVTKSGDLVYIDGRDRTVDVAKNEKIEEVIRLKNWEPIRVCSTSSGDLLIIIQFTPLGITTDSQSHILTADFNNHCVHIIDQDGQFLRYIECELSGLWGLCTDTNDNLFVIQYDNGQVKKIKYLQ
ncbi:uncharacterized protein LOC134273662 [Saccostrea cucullata]|uniref:uncharacterized protein LOC134273662 n=1 Tax=Saccostrea cuccullata TaxID=36930 RepID=UPI002ED0CEFB